MMMMVVVMMMMLLVAMVVVVFDHSIYLFTYLFNTLKQQRAKPKQYIQYNAKNYYSYTP